MNVVKQHYEYYKENCQGESVEAEWVKEVKLKDQHRESCQKVRNNEETTNDIVNIDCEQVHKRSLNKVLHMYSIHSKKFWIYFMSQRNC